MREADFFKLDTYLSYEESLKNESDKAEKGFNKLV